ASAAFGRPVKITSAHFSLITGPELRLQGVSVGDVKMAGVRASAHVATLLGDKKTFSRVELEGLTLPQKALGEALLGKLGTDSLSIARIVANQIKLQGPLPLPPLDAELVLGEDGALRSA